MKDLYDKRPLAEAYPDLENIGVRHFVTVQESWGTTDELLACLDRLVGIDGGSRTAVTDRWLRIFVVVSLIALLLRRTQRQLHRFTT